MKRILSVVAVLAVLTAACSSADEVVATVNAVDVHRSDVELLTPPSGESAGAADFTSYLSVVIQWSAISQSAAAEFSIEPTADEITERLDDLVLGAGTGVSLAEFLKEVDASEAGIREYAKQLIIQDEVSARLSDALGQVSAEEATQELIDAPLSWAVVCTSHILVGTEAEALAAAERLEAGEPFSVVASELSIDAPTAANGGDLGCNAPAAFAPAFAEATMSADLNVASAPFETEFGWHLVFVTQREEATIEIVQETIQQGRLTEAVDEWFNSSLHNAAVTVDESIGVWATDPSPQVLKQN